MKKYVVLCAISALLGALLSTALRTHSVEPRLSAQEAPAPGLQQAVLDELTAVERVNVAVYERVNRSVVNITTLIVRPDMFLMLEPPSEGAGSGSVLDQEGHILTNYHVIEGAGR